MATAVLAAEVEAVHVEEQVSEPMAATWGYTMPYAGVKYYSYRLEPVLSDIPGLPFDLFDGAHEGYWDFLL
jgi:hypothetical protein